jgi:hypothetical protein
MRDQEYSRRFASRWEDGLGALYDALEHFTPLFSEKHANHLHTRWRRSHRAGLALYSVTQPLQVDDVKATSLTVPPRLPIDGTVVPISVTLLNSGPRIDTALVAQVFAEQNGFVAFVAELRLRETSNAKV